MNDIKALFALCFSLLPAACSCIAVTYPGDPEGATAVCNGNAYGETPLTINSLLEGGRNVSVPLSRY